MRNLIDTVARWLMTYAFPGDHVHHSKPEPVDPRRAEIEAWYVQELRAVNEKYAQLHDAQVFQQNRELDALYFELRRRLTAIQEESQ